MMRKDKTGARGKDKRSSLLVRGSRVVVLGADPQATIGPEKAPIAIADGNMVPVPVPIVRAKPVAPNSRPRGVVISLEPRQRSDGHTEPMVAAVIWTARSLAGRTIVPIEALALAGAIVAQASSGALSLDPTAAISRLSQTNVEQEAGHCCT